MFIALQAEYDDVSNGAFFFLSYRTTSRSPNHKSSKLLQRLLAIFQPFLGFGVSDLVVLAIGALSEDGQEQEDNEKDIWLPYSQSSRSEE